MPVPTPPKNDKNNKGTNWGRASKNLSFWIRLALCNALLQSSLTGLNHGSVDSRCVLLTPVLMQHEFGDVGAIVLVRALSNPLLWDIIFSWATIATTARIAAFHKWVSFPKKISWGAHRGFG